MTINVELYDVAKYKEARLAKKEDVPPKYRAEIVEQRDASGNDSVYVDGRAYPFYVWVRLWSSTGSVLPAFNGAGVPAISGMPVYVTRSRGTNELEIVGVDRELIQYTDFYEGFSPVMAHHLAHEWPDGSPGFDAVSTYPRSWTQLRTYQTNPLGTSVNVAPLRYPIAAAAAKFDGGQVALAAAIAALAAGEARLVLVYLDMSTNLLGTTNGTIGVDADGWMLDEPAYAADQIASAVVRIYGGQTEISELDIRDRRFFLNTTESAAGWPYDTEIATVDTLDPHADYPNIALAIAGGGKNTILMSPETHVCANQHLNAGENLRGMDLEASVLESTTHTVCLRCGDGCHIIDITIEADYDYAGWTQALYIDNDVDTAELWRVRVIGANQTDDIRVLRIDDAVTSVKLWNCYVYGDAKNTGYGLLIDNAAVTGPTVYIYGGYYWGTTYDINVGQNATVYLYGPTLGNSTINIGAGATVQGWWYSASGVLNAAGGTQIGLSTDESRKTGPIYQQLTSDIYADGEWDAGAGIFARGYNRVGIGNYNTHAREGAGIPTGFTGWQLAPAIAYCAQDPAFTGYRRNTFYEMMPLNVAPQMAFLAHVPGGAITSSKFHYGRFSTTEGQDIGLRVDNYDAGHAYILNERWYYCEIILFGLTPRTQITYNHGYFTWNGAAWVGPTNTAGASVTVEPMSEFIVIAQYVNYGVNVNSIANYVCSETGRLSVFGNTAFFLGPGAVNPKGAYRGGAVVQHRNYVGCAFDWWYRQW